MLWQLVSDLIHALPYDPTWEHVDDLSQPIVQPTSLLLQDAIVTAGRIVASEVKRLDLTLSDKSKVLPDSHATRRAVTILNKEGVPIKVAKIGDDVGVEMAAGARRVAATLNNRIKVRAKA